MSIEFFSVFRVETNKEEELHKWFWASQPSTAIFTPWLCVLLLWIPIHVFHPLFSLYMCFTLHLLLLFSYGFCLLCHALKNPSLHIKQLYKQSGIFSFFNDFILNTYFLNPFGITFGINHGGKFLTYYLLKS